MSKFTRRDFLKGTAGAAAAGSVGMAFNNKRTRKLDGFTSPFQIMINH